MPIAQQLCQCSGRDGFTCIPGTNTFVCAKCEVPMVGYEKLESGGLAYFRGGPMDGSVYEYEVLMHSDAMVLPIIEYSWTPEIITSPSTGKTARVWRWKGIVVDDAPTIEEVESPMAQNTTSDGTVTADQIRERREKLGVSRPTLATEAGVTVAQLARLEISGKRVKDGLLDQIHNALSKLEKAGGSKKKDEDAPLA